MCVGEDRKSFHQLATDSVWEIFISCCMLKLFTFNIQNLTIAANVLNNEQMRGFEEPQIIKWNT